MIITSDSNFCNKCGCKLPDDSNFCNKCGYKISKENNIKQPTSRSMIELYPEDSEDLGKVDENKIKPKQDLPMSALLLGLIGGLSAFIVALKFLAILGTIISGIIIVILESLDISRMSDGYRFVASVGKSLDKLGKYKPVLTGVIPVLVAVIFISIYIIWEKSASKK
jgi:hypothetical protein